MGKHKRARQGELLIEAGPLAPRPGHPFYRRLNEILARHGFDERAETICAKFYAETMGRPPLAPAVYFRLLLIGYFEGIDFDRGIARRVADSITLREFLGYRLTEATPDHSTISRNRRLFDLEAHEEVLTWVLAVLAKKGLLSGKTLGIDATTLEANAALRKIVWWDTGERYEESFSNRWPRPRASRRHAGRIWRSWIASVPRKARTSLAEIVADIGYHSTAVLTWPAKLGIRTYISEPAGGRRRWRDKPAEKDTAYGYRRRIRGARGKRVLRARGEAALEVALERLRHQIGHPWDATHHSSPAAGA